jgi:hypothetical protein
MALNNDQLSALANERRYQELKRKEGRLLGQIDAAGQVSSAADNVSRSAAESLRGLRDEITALEQGAGPGLAEDFGPYSTVEQAMRTERFTGKGACIDFVKANPECTEADAVQAYTTAALAARPSERQYLLQSVEGLLHEYRLNALGLGLILEDTWEEFRAYIVATSKDTLMGR